MSLVIVDGVCIFPEEASIILYTRLAICYGVCEAILTQQLHVLTSSKTQKEWDGNVWVRSTYEDWAGHIGYLYSANTIRKALKHLERESVLYTGNFNTHRMDNTKWYRLNYKCVNRYMEPKA